MTIQIGLQCHNEGSAGEASGGKKAIVPREELSQEEIDEKLFEVSEKILFSAIIFGHLFFQIEWSL